MSGTAWLVADDRFTPLPAGWEPLTGHRTDESWTWRLIDRAGRHVGDLDGVGGGNLTLNVNANTRGTGSLTWSGRHADMPNWRDVLVQPIYSATLLDGSTVAWPMGVYLCASPSIDVADRHARAEVSLYDQTLRLRRAKLTNTWGVPAGTNVVHQIRALFVEYAPITRHALEDSSETLRNSMVWEPGTPILRVMNDLADAAGMFALWADADGLIRTSPYVRPQDRPHVWKFTEGVESVHEENVTHDRDDFDVPNRVTGISRTDGEDEPALRFQLTLDEIDPAHPMAFVRTGEWVDRFEPEVEATSMEVLTQRVERWLREGIAVTSTVTLTHAPLPLALQDKISIDSGGLIIPAATVQTIDIPCAAGEDWTTTIREVVA